MRFFMRSLPPAGSLAGGVAALWTIIEERRNGSRSWLQCTLT
jgi:hypothetical protein